MQILADIENADERVDKLEPLDFKGLGEEFKKLKSAIKLMQDIQDKSKEARDPQLNAVRAAIAAFMPGFEGLQVRRKPRVHMTVEKNGETLNVLQLSQGEKSLMALVGDIARRLAMMNPTLENPLYGQGVVLIDEVDMHLHPSWQRGIIDRLTTTFPHCQFILTTHSPLVISDCKNVLVYSLDDGELSVVPSLYGQDANSVLLDVMDTDIRNAKIATQLNDLLDLIQKKQLNQARSLLEKLMEDLLLIIWNYLKLVYYCANRSYALRKITKSNEPASLTRWKRSNASGVYEDLTEIERRDIRAVCVQEQFYLCAYCCKPISGQNSDTMNEHVQARHHAQHLSLDFNNIVASCTTAKQCDESHGSQLFSLTPLMDECETELEFMISGRVRGNTFRAQEAIRVMTPTY